MALTCEFKKREDCQGERNCGDDGCTGEQGRRLKIMLGEMIVRRKSCQVKGDTVWRRNSYRKWRDAATRARVMFENVNSKSATPENLRM